MTSPTSPTGPAKRFSGDFLENLQAVMLRQASSNAGHLSSEDEGLPRSPPQSALFTPPGGGNRLSTSSRSLLSDTDESDCSEDSSSHSNAFPSATRLLDTSVLRHRVAVSRPRQRRRPTSMTSPPASASNRTKSTTSPTPQPLKGISEEPSGAIKARIEAGAWRESNLKCDSTPASNKSPIASELEKVMLKPRKPVPQPVKDKPIPTKKKSPIPLPKKEPEADEVAEEKKNEPVTEALIQPKKKPISLPKTEPEVEVKEEKKEPVKEAIIQPRRKTPTQLPKSEAGPEEVNEDQVKEEKKEAEEPRTVNLRPIKKVSSPAATSNTSRRITVNVNKTLPIALTTTVTGLPEPKTSSTEDPHQALERTRSRSMSSPPVSPPASQVSVATASRKFDTNAADVSVRRHHSQVFPPKKPLIPGSSSPSATAKPIVPVPTTKKTGSTPSNTKQIIPIPSSKVKPSKPEPAAAKPLKKINTDSEKTEISKKELSANSSAPGWKNAPLRKVQTDNNSLSSNTSETAATTGFPVRLRPAVTKRPQSMMVNVSKPAEPEEKGDSKTETGSRKSVHDLMKKFQQTQEA